MKESHAYSSHRTSRSRHIIPLRRFLEGVFNQDLRNFFAESCFEVIINILSVHV